MYGSEYGQNGLYATTTSLQFRSNTFFQSGIIRFGEDGRSCLQQTSELLLNSSERSKTISLRHSIGDCFRRLKTADTILPECGWVMIEDVEGI